MLKWISIVTVASLTFFAGSVKADLSDCINQLVPLGVSRDQAEQACSKACQSGRNNGSKRELDKLCKVAQTGNGNTLYYSNGQIMTNHAGEKGATWYHSNGQIITNHAGEKGATWYHSNGQIITNHAGEKGATWYHSNGQLMTHYAGKKGATWYHSNGQLMTNHDNLILEEELLYPCSYIE